jgi:hypothetical protein
MLNSAIEHYIRSGTPSQEDLHVLRRIVLRRRAHDALFDRLGEKANMGFLRIEKVASPEPVTLFGQNAPSYAYNRIVIRFGEDRDGGRVPGAPLMSALISEESLAQLMLSPNRTNGRVGLTSDSFLGEKLPSFEGGGRTSSTDLLEGAIASSGERRLTGVRALQDAVNGLDRGINKKTAQEMEQLLRHVIPGSDAGFLLQRHAENLEKDLVQYKVEASSAALNLNQILSEIETLRRLGHSGDAHDITDLEAARNTNPMLDVAMDRLRQDEALICQKAVKSYLEARIRSVFPEGLDYNIDQDDPYGRSLKESIPFSQRDSEGVESLKRLATLSSDLGNDARNSSRDQADGYSLTASCAFISGGSKNLHSSFPAGDAGHFTLRFHIGMIEERFGGEHIQEGSTFLEIGLSMEDMMTALRGHPAGEYIPCSLDRVAQRGLERVPAGGVIDKVIADEGEDRRLSGLREDIKPLVSEARDIIRSGARKSSERKYLADIVSRLGDLVEALNEAEADNIAYRADQMNAQVHTMAKDALSVINDHVVEKYGVGLHQIGQDPDMDNLSPGT